MKQILLTLSVLVTAVFTSFATNEKLSVLQSNVATGDYWEVDSANIKLQDPCASLHFKVDYTVPTGYTVKQFDWYVNDVLVQTTPASQNETNIQVSAHRTAVVCKVIYQKTGASNITSASPVYGLHGNSLNLVLNGPTNVDILSRAASYSISTGGSSFAFTPAPGTYSTTWQAPSGWVAGTPSNNGNNITFTADNYTGGQVTATSTYHSGACAYPQSISVTVSRPHPAPGFTITSPTRVCGNQSGDPVTRTYSIATVPGASSYTYTVEPEPASSQPLDMVSLNASTTVTTLTTTSTSVNLYFSSVLDQNLYLNVKANYPDGLSSYETNLLILYTTMNWSPTITWSPSCLNGVEPNNAPFSATVTPITGAYYYWYIDGFMVDQGYSNTIFGYWNGESQLQVKAVTDCGSTSLWSDYFPIFCSGFTTSNLSVYPNPTTGQMKVDIKELNRNIKAPNAFIKDIREIRIVDKLGNVKKLTSFPTGTRIATLDISGLPSDIYIVQVSDGLNRTSVHISKTR